MEGHAERQQPETHGGAWTRLPRVGPSSRVLKKCSGAHKYLAQVFVSNLPWGAAVGHLRRLFSDLAPHAVVRVHLLTQAGRGGRSKGAAFVRLRTPELAVEACATIGNRSLAAPDKVNPTPSTLHPQL